MAMTFKILPEFRDRIPSLSKDERDRLEANILKDGCREPLCLWYSDLDDETFLLDGHNRYEICTRLRIGFETVDIDGIETTVEALDWIDRNQIGKRNLSPDDFKIISGRIYNHRKKAHGNEGGASDRTKLSPQIEDLKTSTIVASELGVSKATIERNGQRAEVYDAMKSIGDDEAADAAKTLPQTFVAKAVVEVKQKQDPELSKAESKAKELDDRLRVAAELKAAKAVHVSQNTGVPEWYTPSMFIDKATRVLGCIDTDPASSDIAQKTVQAKTYYTIEQNGLDYKWGGSVWLNPPYTAGLVDKFIEKLVLHLNNGDVCSAIVLVNNATETKWFQLVMGASDAVCFPSSRVRFLDPDGNPGAPLQGQAILYAGDNPSLFCSVFSSIGSCAYTQSSVLFSTEKGYMPLFKSVWDDASESGKRAIWLWLVDNYEGTEHPQSCK
jgi:hypothetical protein